MSSMFKNILFDPTDCGSVIELSQSNPSATFSAVPGVEQSCNWLIKVSLLSACLAELLPICLTVFLLACLPTRLPAFHITYTDCKPKLFFFHFMFLAGLEIKVKMGTLFQ